MSEPKTHCSSCGCEILQTTADRNAGLCGRCVRKVEVPRLEDLIELTKRAPPLSRAGLDDVIVSGSRDDVIDALFDPALEKVNYRPHELTDGDVIVYTVCTFHGETLNGGLWQYFFNQSQQWAHRCGPALRTIGADRYAEIVEECIRTFTKASSPDDPQWQVDLDKYLVSTEEPFEQCERRFSDYFRANNEELPDLLYSYICENRDAFAPFGIDG